MKKEAIERKAKVFLEQNPQVNAVFASADGFLFLHKKDRNNHNATLEEDATYDFTNTVGEKEVLVPSGFLDNSANEIIAEIPNLSRDEAYSYLIKEQVGKKRKTVVAALEKALADVSDEGLNGVADVDGSENVDADQVTKEVENNENETN
ncbi:hypothetical protein [Weeksella virosa]|uniref:Uncharacterized protein n=1 Tax=Weeksella virosa (strain ATCC 43766 / DSM 16922 / JCM 21250 / CCUG 30538 / CDC 9751 / IAM 14551 / NBRC 16016 / NCTC 11634 / CL345/78) TaxID=865938 RepID=F0P2U9_WEEVC|nr:hypothetical protein [Weeksella virosa]ADX66839.1 hypothetical protein Weevi_0113 [Weeksella virosa DSM 16922]VEH63437.1 Uncharacterised protein [Weeksella virosa]